jgi:hypothetical protein
VGRLDRIMLVDKQRAPFPGAASGLSAAISDDPPVPSPPKNISQILPPPPYHESTYIRAFNREKKIGNVEREILVPVYGHYDFQNPQYMASRKLLIARIAATGTSLSPLPCQAWHGYMVTSAYRVEVEVCADGPASAPPSGAAAATPPAGAFWGVCIVLFIVYTWHLCYFNVPIIIMYPISQWRLLSRHYSQRTHVEVNE